MPDVSIIIPVYNIKTLLPRCVASLQAQTWQDFEVWLVDDGSTDGSGPLCDELAVKDARIHVLHKENGGQGLARDLGLDHAQGEYICYVDSDDEVLPNLLEDALRAAREADADIVCYGYYKQPLDGEGNALQRSGPRLPALSGVYTYEEFWKNFRKAKYESMPREALPPGLPAKIQHPLHLAAGGRGRPLFDPAVGRAFPANRLSPQRLLHL